MSRKTAAENEDLQRGIAASTGITTDPRNPAENGKISAATFEYSTNVKDMIDRLYNMMKEKQIAVNSVSTILDKIYENMTIIDYNDVYTTLRSINTLCHDANNLYHNISTYISISIANIILNKVIFAPSNEWDTKKLTSSINNTWDIIQINEYMPGFIAYYKQLNTDKSVITFPEFRNAAAEIQRIKSGMRDKNRPGLINEGCDVKFTTNIYFNLDTYMKFRPYYDYNEYGHKKKPPEGPCVKYIRLMLYDPVKNKILSYNQNCFIFIAIEQQIQNSLRDLIDIKKPNNTVNNIKLPSIPIPINYIEDYNPSIYRRNNVYNTTIPKYISISAICAYNNIILCMIVPDYNINSTNINYIDRTELDILKNNKNLKELDQNDAKVTAEFINKIFS
jgi:hypothetical protein